MCNCIKDLEEKVANKFPEHNRKKVESVTAEAVWPFSNGTLATKRTYTNFNLSLENQIKKVPIVVNHTYCPWCGKKYEDIQEEKKEENGK